MAVNMVNGKKEGDLNNTSVHVCTSCQLDGLQAPAVGYCLVCVEYLCQSCYESHLRPLAMRNHILLSRSLMPDMKIVKAVDMDKCEEVCPDHEGVPLEYFCNKCNLVGCCECMKLKHCQCVGVSSVQAYVRREELQKNKIYDDSWYRRFYSKFSDSPMDRVQELKDKVERYKFAVELEANETRKQVKGFRESVVEALDELENDMDTKIKTISNQELFMFDLLLKKCDIIQDKFEKMKDKIEMCKYADSKKCSLFVNSKIAQREVKKFEEGNTVESLQKYLEIKSIKFQHNFRKAIGEKIVLGDIVEVSAKPKEENYWQDSGRINAKTKAEIEESKASKVYCRSCFISGCIVLNNGKLMVCDTSKDTVRLCNPENGEFSEEVSDVISEVRVEASPKDITQISDDYIALTLPSVKKIQYIKLIEETKIEKGLALNASGECCGIGCLDEKLIISYRNPGKVELLDFKGNVLQLVTNDNNRDFSFLKPVSVTCDHARKLIYVSDFDGDCVVAVNSEGKVKAVFKQAGMVNPLAVTTGKGGSVLVAVKWPFSVQKICPNFLKIEELQVREDTWGIEYVAYSQIHDRLFFGTGSCYVNVRKIN